MARSCVDNGGTTFATTLKSGLNASTSVPQFVAGGKEAAANNRKLFIFTGGDDPVQVISGDGAVTANLATPPSDWSAGNRPTFGVIHDQRLWAGGNANDPHRVYCSTLTSHEDFTSAGSGSLSIFPGVGRKIVRSISFKGLLVVFKWPAGIYAVNTLDPSNSNWTTSVISETIGAAGPGAVLPIEDDVLFMDPQGNFHLLSAVTQYGDLGSKNLSNGGGGQGPESVHMDDFARVNFNFSKLYRAQSVYYPSKSEAHFALTTGTETENKLRVVLDFTTGNPSRPRFYTSSRDVCESLWSRQDADGVPRPMFGDADGFAWSLDQATRSKDGTGYTGSFQSGHDDLSWVDKVLATKVKNGRFLELTVDRKGDYDLTVAVIWDGVGVQVVTFNMGSSGSALGVGMLGSMVLGASAALNRKRRIVGGGRRLSLNCFNSGVGQDFAVSRFILHFQVGDERKGNT
jgi:hypothetical protein